MCTILLTKQAFEVIAVQDIPLIILSKEEGIPIPNTVYSFSLTHETAQKMQTVEIELRPGIKEKFFSIGVSNDTSIAIDICASEEEKARELNNMVLSAYSKLPKKEILIL